MDEQVLALERELQRNPEDLSVAVRLFQARQRCGLTYQNKDFGQWLSHLTTPKQRQQCQRMLEREGAIATAGLLETVLNKGELRDVALDLLIEQAENNSFAILALQELLTHEYQWVREQSLECLLITAPHAPANRARLYENLKHSDVIKQHWALRIISRKKAMIEDSPELREVLVHHLRSVDPEARASVIKIIGALKSAGRWTLPKLKAALDDPSEWVQEHAVEALGQLGKAELIPVMAKLLRSGPPGVQKKALSGLMKSQQGRQIALDELLAKIQHDMGEERMSAITALLSQFSDEAECLNAIAKVLNHDDPKLIADVLGLLQDHSFCSKSLDLKIRSLLGHEERGVRESALHFCEQSHLSASLIDDLLTIAETSEEALCCWALGRIALTSYRPSTPAQQSLRLIELLNKSENCIRQAVLQLLGSHSLGRDCLNEVIDCLSDPASEIQQEAASALRQIGESLENLHPVFVSRLDELLDSLRSTNGELRTNIRSSLYGNAIFNSELVLKLIDESKSSDDAYRAEIVMLINRMPWPCLERSIQSLILKRFDDIAKDDVTSVKMSLLSGLRYVYRSWTAEETFQRIRSLVQSSCDNQELATLAEDLLQDMEICRTDLQSWNSTEQEVEDFNDDVSQNVPEL
jgi:HEAT repeat protein